MKRINYLYIIFIIFLVFQSCRKDIDDIVKTPPYIPPVSKVIGSIHGNVLDDMGNVVSGAMVTFENESVETDENGVFQFIDKKLNKNGTFISVEKEGYFDGSRRFYPSVGTKSIVIIELITLEMNGSFNSSANSKIELDGVELDFPQNSIAYEDGSDFNGMVNVAIAYLDPSDVNTLDQMPGDLTGTSTEGDFVALQSLAMIAVELMDDSGNKLQVKEGKLVDVKIPIPSNLQDDAPASIPMWHFNEDVGLWQEEGVADLVGNNYVTSLAHFSFWNCDLPRVYVTIKGSILNRGIPIQGIKVIVTSLENNTSGYGITDENGMFCGFVPGDAQLVLSVYNQCGDEIYNMTFTTTDEDLIFDPISLNLYEELIMVSGTVSHCDNELSDLAYVKLKHGAQVLTFPILGDGTFQGNISRCYETYPLIVAGYDPVMNLYSGESSFNYEGIPIETGNIEICLENEFQEYVIVEYGDVKRGLVLNDEGHPSFSLIVEQIYLLNVGFPITPDSLVINQFNFTLDSPGGQFQKVKLSLTESGFSASGDFTSEIILQDGKEYIKSTGVLTEIKVEDEDLYNEPVTSVYYDIVVDIKN